jgi:hypothetical protein
MLPEVFIGGWVTCTQTASRTPPMQPVHGDPFLQSRKATGWRFVNQSLKKAEIF